MKALRAPLTPCLAARLKGASLPHLVDEDPGDVKGDGGGRRTHGDAEDSHLAALDDQVDGMDRRRLKHEHT